MLPPPPCDRLYRALMLGQHAAQGVGQVNLTNPIKMWYNSGEAVSATFRPQKAKHLPFMQRGRCRLVSE